MGPSTRHFNKPKPVRFTTHHMFAYPLLSTPNRFDAVTVSYKAYGWP